MTARIHFKLQMGTGMGTGMGSGMGSRMGSGIVNFCLCFICTINISTTIGIATW